MPSSCIQHCGQSAPINKPDDQQGGGLDGRSLRRANKSEVKAVQPNKKGRHKSCPDQQQAGTQDARPTRRAGDSLMSEKSGPKACPTRRAEVTCEPASHTPHTIPLADKVANLASDRWRLSIDRLPSFFHVSSARRRPSQTSHHRRSQHRSWLTRDETTCRSTRWRCEWNGSQM